MPGARRHRPRDLQRQADLVLPAKRSCTTLLRPGYARRWRAPSYTSRSRDHVLPGASVEVSTYEIKRYGEADKIESVYEAAAHGRWAHRASLVVESFADESPVSASVMAEVQRLGLGLYVVSHRPEGRGLAPRYCSRRRESPIPRTSTSSSKTSSETTTSGASSIDRRSAAGKGRTRKRPTANEHKRLRMWGMDATVPPRSRSPHSRPGQNPRPTTARPTKVIQRR